MLRLSHYVFLVLGLMLAYCFAEPQQYRFHGNANVPTDEARPNRPRYRPQQGSRGREEFPTRRDGYAPAGFRPVTPFDLPEPQQEAPNSFSVDDSNKNQQNNNANRRRPAGTYGPPSPHNTYGPPQETYGPPRSNRRTPFVQSNILADVDNGAVDEDVNTDYFDEADDSVSTQFAAQSSADVVNNNNADEKSLITAPQRLEVPFALLQFPAEFRPIQPQQQQQQQRGY